MAPRRRAYIGLSRLRARPSPAMIGPKTPVSCTKISRNGPTSKELVCVIVVSHGASPDQSIERGDERARERVRDAAVFGAPSPKERQQYSVMATSACVVGLRGCFAYAARARSAVVRSFAHRAFIAHSPSASRPAAATRGAHIILTSVDPERCCRTIGAEYVQSECGTVECLHAASAAPGGAGR